MHWDGSVSVGNILTFLGMVAFILGAAHRCKRLMLNGPKGA